MGKFCELITVQQIVEDVLETFPETRNNDNILFCKVYGLIAKQKGIEIESMSVMYFFSRMKENGFPSTETIRRTRQKVQAEREDLRADSYIEAQRIVNEEDFKRYAIGG